MANTVGPPEIARILKLALSELQPRFSLRGEKLYVLIEYPAQVPVGPHLPLQQIQRQLQDHSPTGLTQIVVIGRITGEKHPQWQNVVPLSTPIQPIEISTAPPSAQPSQPPADDHSTPAAPQVDSIVTPNSVYASAPPVDVSNSPISGSNPDLSSVPPSSASPPAPPLPPVNSTQLNSTQSAQSPATPLPPLDLPETPMAPSPSLDPSHPPPPPHPSAPKDLASSTHLPVLPPSRPTASTLSTRIDRAATLLRFSQDYLRSWRQSRLTIALLGSTTGIVIVLAIWSFGQGWPVGGIIGLSLGLVGIAAISRVWILQPAAQTPPHRGSATKHYQRGLGLIRSGDLERAIQEFSVALTLDPQLVDAHIQVGNLLLQRGELEKSIQELSLAQQLQPSRSETEELLTQARLSYANRLVQKSQPKAALTQLQAISQPGELPASQQAEICHTMGWALIAQKDWDQAQTHFQRAIQFNLQLPRAHLGLGMTYYQQGELEASIPACQAALAHDPTLAEAHYQLGLTLFRHGDLLKAIESYQAAIQHTAFPVADLYADLGLALVERGEFVQAQVALKSALAQDDRLAKAHYGVGKVMDASGNPHVAAEKYQTALTIDPNFAAALAAIGLTYLAQKQRDASGKKYISPRQAEAATAKFEAALRKDPNGAEGHFGMGEIYRIRGNLALATQSYRQALKANGSYVAAHYRLGSIFARQGHLELAIESFRTVLKLNPMFPEANTMLNKALAKQMEDVSTDLAPW